MSQNKEINPEGRRNQNFEKMRGKMKMMLPSFSPIKRKSSLSFKNSYSPQKIFDNAIMSPLTQEFNNQESTNPFSMTEQFYLKNVFEQKYEILQKLGEGANGIVKKCKNKITGDLFAVKIGRMQEEHVVTLKKITEMMRKIKHPNILKNKELYIDSERSKYYQVIEYLPYPSLKHLINNHYKFSPSIIANIMKQLLQGLEYFHSHYIVHRDIKTSNLLFDIQKQHLYIIDLGIITRTVQRGKRRNLWTNTGTLQYKAPQTLEGTTYNQGVDMWAAGVVLYELVEGRTPFKQQTCFDIIENICQIKYKFSPEQWVEMPLAKLLVTRLLKFKNQRLEASAALKDPWFQLLNFQYKAPKSQSPLKKNNYMNATSIVQPFNGFYLSAAHKQGASTNQGDDVFIGLSQESKQFLTNSLYQKDKKPKDSISIEQLQNKIFGKSTEQDIINNND